MIDKRYYSRSPITEALIDIRVTLPADVTVDTLRRFVEVENQGYPIHRTRSVVSGAIPMDGTPPPATSQMIDGHIGFSSDKLQIVQARLDGFTFSRLPPYEKWEVFCAEARRLWSVYRDIALPSHISRLAVRYVNRFDIPLPINDLKDFLRTSPEISPDLPQALSGFFFQAQIPQEDIGAVLLINESMAIQGPETVSIILDLDLIRERSESISDTAIWDTLELFHTRVGQAFEACITDRMRELIN